MDWLFRRNKKNSETKQQEQKKKNSETLPFRKRGVTTSNNTKSNNTKSNNTKVTDPNFFLKKNEANSKSFRESKIFSKNTNSNQTMTRVPSVTLYPMPEAEEVNRLYSQIIEEKLGLGGKEMDETKKKALSDMPIEKKWAIVCQHQQLETHAQGKITSNPQFWTAKLKAEPSPILLRDLKICLASETLAWLEEFIKCGGLSLLLQILGNVEQQIHNRKTSNINVKSQHNEEEEHQMQQECIRCLETLMNNKIGLNGAIEADQGIKKLTLCLDMDEDMRLKVVKLLTVVCLFSHKGHRLVLSAMNDYKNKKKEKQPFESLIKFLTETKELEAKNIYLTFINALINSPEDVDARISIRKEFQVLNIENILKQLKNELQLKPPEKREIIEKYLENQINTYEDERNHDEKQVNQRFANLNINIDIEDVLKKLKSLAKETGLFDDFLRILQNLLVLLNNSEENEVEHVGNKDIGIKCFLVISRIVRQISLNKDLIKEISNDKDDEILNKIRTFLDSPWVQNEYTNILPLKQKIEELLNSNEKLNKKCITLEIDLNESQQKIESLKILLEESKKNEVKKESKDLEFQSKEVLEQNTISADSSQLSDITKLLPPPSDLDTPPPPPPPDLDAPLPPPPPGLGPPPPPGMPTTKIMKKKPKVIPSTKLKGLQWNKLPPNKMKGTIFEKFEKEYKGINLDYKDIEEKFAIKTIEKEKKENTNKTIIQLLEPKISQALSIFLSQFKNISCSDIVNGLEKLNSKMFTMEQVKTITTHFPSKEDIQSIQSFIQNGGELNQLPIAERFALELSRVPFMDKKVNAFYFKLSFPIKKEDIKPNMKIIEDASEELLKCTKFHQILELVLELGNFLNEGTPRGGVFGFQLSSLTKLADTKTSDNTMTLLQYLVMVIEKQKPELLKFYEEIPNCEVAMKISLSSLTSELSNLQKDAINTEKFLQEIEKNDQQFYSAMNKFMTKVFEDIQQMKQNFEVMQKKYEEVVKYYGEDPKQTQPEDFFCNIHNFIQSLNEAVKQNEIMIQKAEAEKRRNEAKQQKQNEIESKKVLSPTPFSRMDGEQPMDSVVGELFNALQGGNFFKNRRQNKANIINKEQSKQENHIVDFRKTLRKTGTPVINNSPNNNISNSP